MGPENRSGWADLFPRYPPHQSLSLCLPLSSTIPTTPGGLGQEVCQCDSQSLSPQAQVHGGSDGLCPDPQGEGTCIAFVLNLLRVQMPAPGQIPMAQEWGGAVPWTGRGTQRDLAPNECAMGGQHRKKGRSLTVLPASHQCCLFHCGLLARTVFAGFLEAHALSLCQAEAGLM